MTPRLHNCNKNRRTGRAALRRGRVGRAGRGYKVVQRLAHLGIPHPNSHRIW